MQADNNIRIKYLEMIQSTMTRMASNSFTLKGWAVTLVAGTFALSSKDSDKLFYLVAYIPIILFWFLDAYYLQLERKYRDLYNVAMALPIENIDFNLTVQRGDINKKTSYLQVLLSITEICFYVPLAVLVAGVIIITCVT